jgi:hypothetical protein
MVKEDGITGLDHNLGGFGATIALLGIGIYVTAGPPIKLKDGCVRKSPIFEGRQTACNDAVGSLLSIHKMVGDLRCGISGLRLEHAQLSKGRQKPSRCSHRTFKPDQPQALFRKANLVAVDIEHVRDYSTYPCELGAA